MPPPPQSPLSGIGAWRGRVPEHEVEAVLKDLRRNDQIVRVVLKTRFRHQAAATRILGGLVNPEYRSLIQHVVQGRTTGMGLPGGAGSALEGYRAVASAGVTRGVPPVLDAGVVRPEPGSALGPIYVTTAWVEGTSLDQVKALSSAEKIRILISLVQVLHSLHERCLAFGDLKPSNIVVGDGGSATLIDLDTVRRVGDPRGFAITQDLSPLYAAPEQLDKQTRKTFLASDMYALGRTILQFLGPTPPFPWKDVSHTCLAPNPFDRPTAAQILERIGAPAKEEVPPTSGPHPGVDETEPVDEPETTPGPLLGRTPLGRPYADVRQILGGVSTGQKRRRNAIHELLSLSDAPLTAGGFTWICAGLVALGAAREAGRVSKRAGGLAATGFPDRPWSDIPKGGFLFGSPPNEEGRSPVEPAPCCVQLVRGFQMLSTPVNQALYVVVTGANPSSRSVDPRCPVEQVSWAETTAFCGALSRLIGRLVRLPREAEWEYAARAGTTTRYWSGPEEADLARVGWYRSNSGGSPHPVGELPANRWGLYDVHGNVAEWCTVEVAPGDSVARTLDPAVPPGQGEEAPVRRGGGFDAPPTGVRAASRFPVRSVEGRPDTGFRLLLPPRPGETEGLFASMKGWMGLTSEG